MNIVSNEAQKNDWRSNIDIAIELMDAAADAETAGRRADALFMRLAADRLSALSPRVKALEWHEHVKGVHRAETIIGDYRVWTHHEADGLVFWRLSDGSVKAEGQGTEAECYAAAQADYERRIMSAIEVSASPRVVTDEKRAEVREKFAGIHKALDHITTIRVITEKTERIAELEAALDWYRRTSK